MTLADPCLIAEIGSVHDGSFGNACKLIEAAGFEGIAMVEFKRDSATGQLSLMEINGRFWGSLPLSSRLRKLTQIGVLAGRAPQAAVCV